MLVARIQSRAHGRHVFEVGGSEVVKQRRDLLLGAFFWGKGVEVILSEARARLAAKLGAQRVGEGA